MELEIEEFARLEQIFALALMKNPSVPWWTMYLNYILRRNNLMTDSTGNARKTIAQVYEFVLGKLGIDKDSGTLWKNYIEFVKQGPGSIGAAGWQDQQKMDSLRKVYRQAVSIPTDATRELWTAYHQFETGLNKQTAHRFMQDKTPAFLKASESFVQMSNMTKHLHRDILPRLPPAVGCEGDLEYQEQVNIWKEWIRWERDDPLELKDDDNAEYKKRIFYVYQQATMNLPFEPEFWYEAAEYCFDHNMESEGNDFLANGIDANPESCLLAFRRADRIETTTVREETEDNESLSARGVAVREPYDRVINALYALAKKTKERQDKSIEQIDEAISNQMPQSAVEKDEVDSEQEATRKRLEAEREAQINAVKTTSDTQINLIHKTLTFAWIALMRAMRRVEGKYQARELFKESRKRGRLTSDIYTASAMMEHNCYKDASAAKIFARGLTLYPVDENFALEYIRFLTQINDTTNARATFESVVNKLIAKPELVHKAKGLFYFFHTYESRYGELSQVSKLEKRMAILFPSDPQLSRFAHRYEGSQGDSTFDPIRARPLISMAVQARPPNVYTSIESGHHGRAASAARVTPQASTYLSPRPAAAQLAMLDHVPRLSPKRAFPDDFGSGSDRPMKLARGESPVLKGAAGRRLESAKRRLEPQVQALPSNINFFLSILPKAKYFDALKGQIPASATVSLLQKVTRIGGDQGSDGIGMARGGSSGGGVANYGNHPLPQPPSYGYR
jgi:cleavage stimulation factor subunit 3